MKRIFGAVLLMALAASWARAETCSRQYNDASGAATGTVQLGGYNAASNTYTVTMSLVQVTVSGPSGGGWYTLGSVSAGNRSFAKYNWDAMPSPMVFTVPCGTDLACSVGAALMNNGTVYSNGTVDWVLKIPSGPPVIVMKKVTVQAFNDKDIPLDYMLLDANGNQLGSTFTLQPHTGLVQTFTFPESTPQPLTLVYRVRDFVLDSNGTWTPSPGGVQDTPASVGGVTTGGATGGLTVQDVSGNIVDSIDPPLVVPGDTGLTSREGGSVWKAVSDPTTTPTDVLTKPVYREGVDKITNRIDKVVGALESAPSGVTQKQYAQSAQGDDYKLSVDPTKVTGAVGSILPALPVVTLPQTQTSYSFTLSFPGVEAQTLTLDVAPYSTQIGIFRALVTAGLALSFFFLSLKAIKEAFA